MGTVARTMSRGTKSTGWTDMVLASLGGVSISIRSRAIDTGGCSVSFRVSGRHNVLYYTSMLDPVKSTGESSIDVLVGNIDEVVNEGVSEEVRLVESDMEDIYDVVEVGVCE